MKKSATELMKELKYIANEINDVHAADLEDCCVPVDNDYKPKYENGYSYEANRQKIADLQAREREIKRILANFNNTAKVCGYDFTVAEGLVRLGQIQSEIKTLTTLAGKKKIENATYGVETNILTYDLDKAKADLRKLQRDYCSLQVAIDKTNLNSSLNC